MYKGKCNEFYFQSQTIRSNAMELSNDMEFLTTAIMEITATATVFGKKVLSCWDESGGFNSYYFCYFCPKPENSSETILNVEHETGKKIEVLIDRSCSVSTLKEKIREAGGISPKQQLLMSSGVILENWRPIFDYKIEENTVSCSNDLGIAFVFDFSLRSIEHKEMFDSSKNCDFTWLQEDGQIYKRGNHVYQRME